MITPHNYHDLPTICNTLAQEKGWWDDPRPEHLLQLLCISEITEALEAMRAGKRADKDLALKVAENFNAQVFKANIKDTVEDEIADAAIRCFDVLGANNTEITELYKQATFGYYSLNFKSFISCVMKCDYEGAIEQCYQAATLLDFDLDLHIALKLEYNKTRPNKHGKKF